MSVFPPIALKPKVYDYMKNTFMNAELLAAVGVEAAEERFQRLLSCLSHPPAFTCVRASTHLAPLEEIRHRLGEELRQQRCGQHMCGSEDEEVTILSHPNIPDVLLLPVIGPRSVKQLGSEVVVGALCGSAVLRGAHVFAPGILATPKFMKAGDTVSVFSDLEGKCTRGSKNFQGKRVFLGNGLAGLDRSSIFCTNEPVKGLGIQMVEPLYQSPSFDGVLPSLVFLQNLPSVVVGHVLGPRPGERILDMCAAPGGKTCHIAALMGGQGEVVALDKIRSKVERIRQNAKTLHLDCIRAHCFNSVQAVSGDPARETEGTECEHRRQTASWLRSGCEEAQDRAQGREQLNLSCQSFGPPFPPESFDRVLLDAPCSGLGQRPSMACSWGLKEVCSYQPLQRKLFHTAMQLLRRGGVLVYSTCTVTLAENEEQVAWALKTFPCLTLQPQEPHIGAEGMMGAGLSPDQRRLLQRFSPELSWAGPPPVALPSRADTDTIGFFIAKFQKS
ncbi:tRNA (cytosine(72)-C(5))-methyltransferase NSUN6 isoform X1 [Osmerus eperlanus]|uniref:tRNA (cytosine(72)-C(5))-methyltransferase NSUN6 isoform X1 n=1 Tax=Osmerus eperlanus TaxID=29151 RepID=UPI002E115DE5